MMSGGTLSPDWEVVNRTLFGSETLPLRSFDCTTARYGVFGVSPVSVSTWLVRKPLNARVPIPQLTSPLASLSVCHEIVAVVALMLVTNGPAMIFGAVVSVVTAVVVLNVSDTPPTVSTVLVVVLGA